MGFSQLDKPAQFLKGVGPARAESLARLGILTARDLLYWVPRRYDDASTLHPIASLEVGMDATVAGTVRTKGVIPTRSGLRIFQAVLQDDSGMITCSWPGQPWLDRKLRQGDRILVTGPIRFFHGRQIQPRELVVLARASDVEREEVPTDGTIFVTYPASDDVPQWVLRRLFDLNLDALLERAGDDEALSAEDRSELGLPALEAALRTLHRPRDLSEVEAGRRRLAFDELFFLQLLQARARHQATVQRPGIVFRRTNRIIRPLHERLPFELTEAQARVLREIYADMCSNRRMNRMLQGDVGAGKTLVALFAMALAAESGYQSALMAPTEILAEQHAIRLTTRAEGVPLRVVLLTGRQAAAERRASLEAVRSGDADVVVGTHALIQESVRFEQLGLAIVDEQHRFGVRQRMALGDQGVAPDVLVMSATPIPRSLAMALYGDLDLSVLDERPPGRTPVRTLVRFPRDRPAVYAEIERELAAGRQAYVVVPLIEESEAVDLTAATDERERLQSDVFPARRVGLLHGRMASQEKSSTMAAFARGDIDVLVSTSVIEVGIDVANATVMVIEHAERFGLSQLHQLRGRVGRGEGVSTCYLVAEPGEVAMERLRVLRDTDDGFAVARADLRIRGQGEFLGSRQHGTQTLLRFADLETDEPLLVEAQRRARAIVDSDPELNAPAHARLRELLMGRYAERLRMSEVG